MSRHKPIVKGKLLAKIGSNLKTLLAAKGYSYRSFQKEHGITSVTMCDIVKCHSVPTIPMLIRIANALKVSLSDLIGE